MLTVFGSISNNINSNKIYKPSIHFVLGVYLFLEIYMNNIIIKENSIPDFLEKWNFIKVPCRSPIDCLIEHGFFKAIRRTKRFRLYARRHKDYIVPFSEYWLLLDNNLYRSQSIPCEYGIKKVADEIEYLIDNKKSA